MYEDMECINRGLADRQPGLHSTHVRLTRTRASIPELDSDFTNGENAPVMSTADQLSNYFIKTGKPSMVRWLEQYPHPHPTVCIQDVAVCYSLKTCFCVDWKE